MDHERKFLPFAAALAIAAVGCSSSDPSKDDHGNQNENGSSNPGGGGDGGGSGGWPGGSSNDGGASTPIEVTPAVSTFAELGIVPFDADRDDLVGPKSWDTQYGKLPEIVPAAGASFVDVAVRHANESAGPALAVVRLEPNGAGGWHVTRAYRVRSLGNLLGFARAADDTYYYATGSKDPDVTATFPAPKQHRANVLRALRFDSKGTSLFDIDIDTAREAANKDAEPIVDPGAASSSRLSVAGNVLALVHGIHTAPDTKGTRHQKAASTFFDANTGAIRQTSSIWVSHSFDQRHLVDGGDLYEFHLGDAFPRATSIACVHDAKAGKAQTVFRPKGATGQNNTFTRLGNLVRIDAGVAAGSFLGLVATERTQDTGALVSGSRDLALVRMTPDLAKGNADDVVDAKFGVASTTNSGEKNVENRLLYLTTYDATAPGRSHAERPKLVAIGNGEFIVLYEEWTLAGDKQTYNGTFGMRIDGDGKVLQAAKSISQHHLPRGDDAFAYGGGAAWVTGDKTTRALTIHTVSASLDVADHVIP